MNNIKPAIEKCTRPDEMYRIGRRTQKQKAKGFKRGPATHQCGCEAFIQPKIRIYFLKTKYYKKLKNKVKSDLSCILVWGTMFSFDFPVDILPALWSHRSTYSNMNAC